MDEPALHQEVIEGLDGWAAGLGPTLAAAWGALRARLRLDAPPGYFLHPLALPVLQLPVWVAAGPAPAPPARVRAAVDSAAAGYLGVRVLDDLLDEQVAEGPATWMLAQALLARHHALAGQVAADCPAWHELSGRRWAAFAEAMAREATLSPEQALDPALFHLLLQRSGPLVLPPAALLLPAAPALLGPLCALVDDLAHSHQLFTDAVDAEKDLRHGNRSHVLDRMGAAQGPAAVRRRLYLEGGLDQVFDEAVALVGSARAHARAAGLTAAEGWLDRRLRTMEEVRRQAFARLFHLLIDKLSPDH
ncbi:hypothetical protein L6R53_19515 [Myxococcota bacterium]|nr:hypothetical protein [Myxococcota bacterium]